ncbi:MAG: hypothetical protein OEN55_07930 [Alphaproteobacteria bacterium]|nr:hypothetical protein [Alphaproteobacteria bacterium]
MKRRIFVRFAVAGTAWFALSGHTPYRHWTIYRQKHLLIGACKTDPPSYPLAERIAGTLVRHLPESSARASRAPDQRRVASLLASDQWQVSVMRRQDAADLAAGRGLFETTGAVPLNSLFAMGGHLLVCRPDFPDRHGWLVTATLTKNAADIPDGTAPEHGVIPAHPGALAYAAGKPLPPGPAAGETGPEADHGHPH